MEYLSACVEHMQQITNIALLHAHVRLSRNLRFCLKALHLSSTASHSTSMPGAICNSVAIVRGMQVDRGMYVPSVRVIS